MFADAKPHLRLSKNENVYGTLGEKSVSSGNASGWAGRRRTGRDGEGRFMTPGLSAPRLA